jgi:hypothetical protein
VKHRFLLDENILYFAIYGVDEHDQPDLTSAELVRRIGANCHRIVVNNFLRERYWVPINQAINEGRRPRAMEPVSFIVQLQMNSEKWSLELSDCPELPAHVDVPAEDIHIVRLALLSQTIIVSGDAELRAAVNGTPVLGLRALTPSEALVLAADS